MQPITLTEAYERVACGVRLLNEQLGSNWHYRINQEILNIKYYGNCILGQLFNGEYCLGLDSLKISINDNVPYHYGFNGRETHEYTAYVKDCDILTLAWKVILSEM